MSRCPLPNKERSTQAIGIPQVIRTPGKFFDMARFIREEIIGKPMPEKYDHYEDFVEALVVWVLEHPLPQQASKALNPQEKRRRIDNANIQIVKLRARP